MVNLRDHWVTGELFLKQGQLNLLSIIGELVKSFIESNRDNFKPGCVITDATGVKGMFINDILEILPNEVDFVFGHLMAGRKKEGLILHQVVFLKELII